MTKVVKTLWRWMRLGWDIGGLAFWAVVVVVLLSLLGFAEWMRRDSLDWQLS